MSLTESPRPKNITHVIVLPVGEHGLFFWGQNPGHLGGRSATRTKGKPL
ncbi:hypothetical protein ACN08Z_02280 [Rothia sp. P7181]